MMSQQPYPIRVGAHDLLVARFEEDGRSASLHLAGELDIAVAEPAARLLKDLIGRDYARLVVVLDDLTFCDLAGVRVFLEVHRQAGGRVAFQGFRPDVMRLLDLMGATGVLCPSARTTPA
jgi:anti-anti-sigma factor